MKKNIAPLLLIALLSTPPAMAGDLPAGDFDLLRTNLVRSYIDTAPDSATVENLAKRLTPDGSWPDIDYTNQDRGGWTVYGHVGRLSDMAAAYRNPQHSLHGDKRLRTAVLNALDHWLRHDYTNPNWWFGQIGVPRDMVGIVLMMQDELTPEQLEKSLKIIGRTKIGRTGQNKVWQSGIVVVHGAIRRDNDMVTAGIESILDELRVSADEGIQDDWSFHQHGPQLQFGNYGASYLGDMIWWAGLVQGTRWEVSAEKIEILRNYLLEGQQWVLWRGAMDVSSCGRQIKPGDAAKKGRGIADKALLLSKLDPTRTDQYNAVAQAHKIDRRASNRLNGNRHFWRSDLMVQRRPTFYLSVKCCSTRVIGAESCNSENIQSYFLGDGLTLLYRSGDDYEDISPFWDWRKLPGVTSPQIPGKLPVLTAKGYRNKSDFVGGVSDATNGVMTMHYNREGLTGRKSWFLLDNVLVSLGTGIETDRDLQVCTGIDQRHMVGPVTASIGGRVTPLTGYQPGRRNLKWIHHNGIGYLMLEPMNITVQAESVTGTWNSCYSRLSTDPVSAEMLRMWIDHGTRPQASSYAYVTLPGVDAQDMPDSVEELGIRVLANTESLQAAARSYGGTNLLQIVFHESGTCQVDRRSTVTTTEPCLVMISEDLDRARATLSVADPTQKLTDIDITLSIRGSRPKTYAVRLPQGQQAGRSVTLPLP